MPSLEGTLLATDLEKQMPPNWKQCGASMGWRSTVISESSSRIGPQEQVAPGYPCRGCPGQIGGKGCW